jgi:predicted RNA binding protein YcfA (HicA-like mRNA interferase family)
MSKSRLSPNKEVNGVVKKALKSGWRVEKSSGSHILFFPPDVDDGFVTMSSTPSSTRNYKNALSKLRSKGLKI